MRLSENILHVRSPFDLARFYRRCLGARVTTEGDGPGHGGAVRVEFGSPGRVGASPADPLRAAGLELRPIGPSEADRDPSGAPSAYWKIGLTHPHVDRMRAALVESGVDVTEAEQFLDVGYLCHFRDPEQFEIELLQQTFEQSARIRSRKRLTNQLTLGQITLRVRDADRSVSFYQDVLGMRLLSRQVIEPHGFTLYFLACGDERPPDPDPDAVANREWLWQRPYTTLELQHRWRAGPREVAGGQATGAGFWGLGFTADDADRLVAVRRAAVSRPESRLAVSPEPDTLLIHDPDGNWIRVRRSG